MATVHPSRLRLVPGAKNPPSARRESPPLRERRAPEPPAQPLSREEELRQKLLARRRSNGHAGPSQEGKSLAERISGASGPASDGSSGRPREIQVKGRGKLRAWSDDERDTPAVPSSGEVDGHSGGRGDEVRHGEARRPRSPSYGQTDRDRRRTRSPPARPSDRSPSRGRSSDSRPDEGRYRRASPSPNGYRRRSRARDSPSRREPGLDHRYRYDDRRYEDERSYRPSRSPPAQPRERRPSPGFRDDRRPSPPYPARSPLRLGFDQAPAGLPPPQHAMPPFPPSRPPLGGPSQYGYRPGRHDLGGSLGPPGGPPTYLGPPQRIGFDVQPRHQGRGSSNLEQRREEREKSNISIWPPSPKEPYKDEEELEAERKAAKKARKERSHRSSRSKRKSRRYEDETSSDDSDNGYDSDNRRRARRYRSSKKDEYDSDAETDSSRAHRKRRSDRRRIRRYSDDSESEVSDHDEISRSRRSEKRRKHRRKYDSEESAESGREDRSRRRRTKTRTPSGDDRKDAGDEGWVEKQGESSALLAASDPAEVLLSDDEEVGPQLPSDIHHKDRRDKYSHMLKGEAEAMAAFAAAGERIPRRGEIGIDSEKIQAFEDAGYVMSGNRNKRMNAVRLRKENQVINAEEKRAILNLQREEKLRKEGAIISQFKEMMDETLRKQGLKGMHDV